MSRWSVRVSVAVVGLILVAAPASAQTILKVDGSTGAMPLVAALAKSYETRTPDVRIEIGKGLGTKARIDALKAGRIDIAVASHGLKIDDLRQQGIIVEEIARTPVVFAVNSSVHVASLTQAQICSIYSGAVTNWKEVGGGDLPIAARTRPDSEVDAEVVRDGIACLKELTMPAGVIIMERGGDMARELATTVGAVGMSTTTVADQSGGKITALSLDGIAPTEANVATGTYRLLREVFLVINASASPSVQAFIAFAKGADGASVIRTNGAIPKS
jgi:phosphate transport system substrate-binding protein